MANFESLKAGDKVFLSSRWSDLRIEVVEKVGKLHVTLKNGLKYKKDSGRKVGSDAWNCEYMRTFSEVEWAAYAERQADQKIIRELCEYKWKGLDIATARKIHAQLFVG